MAEITYAVSIADLKRLSLECGGCHSVVGVNITALEGWRVVRCPQCGREWLDGVVEDTTLLQRALQEISSTLMRVAELTSKAKCIVRLELPPPPTT